MAEGTKKDIGTSLPDDYSVHYLEGGEVIWERGRKKGSLTGMSNPVYAHDGTLTRIRAALLEALEQVESWDALHSNHLD